MRSLQNSFRMPSSRGIFNNNRITHSNIKILYIKMNARVDYDGRTQKKSNKIIILMNVNEANWSLGVKNT